MAEITLDMKDIIIFQGHKHTLEYDTGADVWYLEIAD